MAAPAYASSAVTTNTSATTINVTKPTGVVAGSLLVTVHVIYNTDATITLLSGWTFRHKVTGTGTNKIYLHLYDRVADGSEGASFTWTKDTAEYWDIACIRVSGNNTSVPFDTSSGNEGTSATPTALGVTTAAADELLMILTAGFNNPLTADYTGFGTPNVTYDTVNFVHSKGQAAAGATGNFSASKTSDEWATIMAAYKSLPSGNDLGVSGGRLLFRPGRGPHPRWVQHWDSHERGSAVAEIDGVRFGDLIAEDMFLGDTKVTAAYLGDVWIFP